MAVPNGHLVAALQGGDGKKVRCTIRPSIDAGQRDGHCSYSPDGRWMLYDSYPDAAKKQHLYLYDLQRRRGRELGAFAALPVAITDVRCDLHPRWLPDGRISFDSTHDGHRGLYLVDPREMMQAWGREP